MTIYWNWVATVLVICAGDAFIRLIISRVFAPRPRANS